MSSRYINTELYGEIGYYESVLRVTDVFIERTKTERCATAELRVLNARSFRITCLIQLGRYREASLDIKQLLQQYLDDERLEYQRYVAFTMVQYGFVAGMQGNPQLQRLLCHELITQFGNHKDELISEYVLEAYVFHAKFIMGEGQHVTGIKLMRKALEKYQHLKSDIAQQYISEVMMELVYARKN